MNEERKRTWMKIHTGLLDPKHREALGVRIWLFMHIIDRAEWETGTVKGWIDGQHAALLKMPESTLRKQRRELEESGYIQSAPGFQCQNLTIMRWRNPREVNPPQINLPDDAGEGCPKVDTHSGIVLDTHPDSKVDTPTIESDSFQIETSSQEEDDEIPAVYQTATAFAVWEDERLGKLTPANGAMIGEWIDDVGERQTILFMLAASARNAGSPRDYIEACIAKHQQRPTRAEVRQQTALLKEYGPPEDDERPAPTIPTANEVIWAAVCEDLKMSLPPETYAEWMVGTSLVSFEGGRAVIAVRDNAGSHWLQERLAPKIRGALNRATGETVESAEFVVRETEGA